MKKLKVIDLVVSVVTLGGAIAATVVTHNGPLEILYYIPYLAWEIGCAIYAKMKRWW